MAFQAGGSDIVLAIKGAIALYEYGFVEENAADVRYKTFQNEVLNFRYLLEKLDRSLQDAHDRYTAGGLLAKARKALDPFAPDFEEERKALIGNFLATIKDCEKLLEKNKEFKFRYSNTYENLRWHLTKQDQLADVLRQRIQFHSEKIKLVIDRLSIGLLTDMDAKIDDLLAVTNENLLVSREILGRLRNSDISEGETVDVHQASVSIEVKFETFFLANSPFGQGNLALPEAFDALYSHFEESIEGADQTPEKYLQLLKTRFLLGKVQQSEAFELARPGLYYRRAINQIAQAIMARVRDPAEVVRYDEDILLALPESAYSIWPSPEPVTTEIAFQSQPLIPRANEIMAVRLDLACAANQTPDVVTVFKHSDENFRVVLETTTLKGEKVIQTQQLYAREDRLIPRYALPTLTNPCQEMAIYSRGEMTTFQFQSAAHLLKFQSAFVNFDVQHDQARISCQFSDDTLDCANSRVQFFQDPIILEGAPRNDSAHTQSSQALTDTSLPSIGPSIAATNTIRRTEHGWEGGDIKYANAVIYAELKKPKNCLAIISFSLGLGMRLDDAQCRCSSEWDTCPYMVIVKGQGEKFPVNVLYGGRQEGKPDPNDYDILPLRSMGRNQHPRQQPTQVSYVRFKFKSLEAKKEFSKEILLRWRIRDKQLQEQKSFVENLRRRQDRPASTSSNLHTLRPHQNHTHRPSLPHHIEAPENGPEFAAAMKSYLNRNTMTITISPDEPSTTRAFGRVPTNTTLLSTSPRSYPGFAPSAAGRQSSRRDTDFSEPSFENPTARKKKEGGKEHWWSRKK